MKDFIFQLRSSIIVYFIYAFEIHRPNVNSVQQLSLNWNNINNLCHKRTMLLLSSQLCPLPLNPCIQFAVNISHINPDVGSSALSTRTCPVLSCLYPTSDEDLDINKRDQFSYKPADTGQRGRCWAFLTYNYYHVILSYNNIVHFSRSIVSATEVHLL